jgi:hypothetical protein
VGRRVLHSRFARAITGNAAWTFSARPLHPFFLAPRLAAPPPDPAEARSLRKAFGKALTNTLGAGIPAFLSNSHDAAARAVRASGLRCGSLPSGSGVQEGVCK